MTAALRVAVLAESPTDEAVALEIVAAVRRVPVELAVGSRTRARGWPDVRLRLASAVRQAHFDPSVDALVVLADADRSVVHGSTGHAALTPDVGCRLCQLQGAADAELERCAATASRPKPLRLAIGTPVPALEAWLLAGVRSDASEAGWAAAVREGRWLAVPRSLKTAAYGGVVVATEVMVPRARELVQDALSRGDLLRTAFPGGYGAFEAAIRAW